VRPARSRTTRSEAFFFKAASAALVANSLLFKGLPFLSLRFPFSSNR
jgi:hypothetical protein